MIQKDFIANVHQRKSRRIRDQDLKLAKMKVLHFHVSRYENLGSQFLVIGSEIPNGQILF